MRNVPLQPVTNYWRTPLIFAGCSPRNVVYWRIPVLRGGSWAYKLGYPWSMVVTHLSWDIRPVSMVIFGYALTRWDCTPKYYPPSSGHHLMVIPSQAIQILRLQVLLSASKLLPQLASAWGAKEVKVCEMKGSRWVKTIYCIGPGKIKDLLQENQEKLQFIMTEQVAIDVYLIISRFPMFFSFFFPGLPKLRPESAGWRSLWCSWWIIQQYSKHLLVHYIIIQLCRELKSSGL